MKPPFRHLTSIKDANCNPWLDYVPRLSLRDAALLKRLRPPGLVAFSFLASEISVWVSLVLPRLKGEKPMTNKLLLAAIAFGLWANAATSLVRPVQAQTDQLASEVRRIAEELRQLVENGDQCLNPKLCQR
jgi:outer membrane murein-binding lipoprotein Lpp